MTKDDFCSTVLSMEAASLMQGALGIDGLLCVCGGGSEPGHGSLLLSKAPVVGC